MLREITQEVIKMAANNSLSAYRNDSMPRVLVVDDDEQIRKMVQRSLNKLWPEVEIFQAGDGFQATRMADELRPNLVILDLMLPGQDGFAVADEIRKNPKLKSTMVLGITGYNTPENIKTIMAKGAGDCLAKPFGVQELKNLLSRYLGQEVSASREAALLQHQGSGTSSLKARSHSAKQYSSEASGARPLGKGAIEQGIETSCSTVEKKTEKEPQLALINTATLIGFMISGLSSRGYADVSYTSLTQKTEIEEPPAETARLTLSDTLATISSSERGNLSRAAERVSPPLEKSETLSIEKVAIVPFESSNLYITGKSFSYILLEHVTKKFKQLTVIERPDIEKVLDEQRLSLTGVIKQGKIRNVGDIEPVDAIVTGAVRTMEYFGDDGGSIVVAVKVVDVSNGKILWAHNQEARCYSVGVDRKALAEELMNRAAKKITKKMKSAMFTKKQRTVKSAASNMKKENVPFTGTARATVTDTVATINAASRGNPVGAPEGVTPPFKKIAVLPFESWNQYLSGNTLRNYFVNQMVKDCPKLTVLTERELHDNFQKRSAETELKVPVDEIPAESDEVTLVGNMEVKRMKSARYDPQKQAALPKKMVATPKTLGVDAILVGKITTLEIILGNQGAISVFCQLVDADTGKVLWTHNQEAKMKPKWIHLESKYKSPMEVADILLQQVAQKSIEQLRCQFPQLDSAPSYGQVDPVRGLPETEEVQLARSRY